MNILREIKTKLLLLLYIDMFLTNKVQKMKWFGIIDVMT